MENDEHGMINIVEISAKRAYEKQDEYIVRLEVVSGKCGGLPKWFLKSGRFKQKNLVSFDSALTMIL